MSLAAGWADHVARRIKSSEYILSMQMRAEADGKKKAIRYACEALDEEIYLHPSSGLSKTAPDFVVYQELLQTEKRTYMSVVSEIEALWLPDCSAALCTFSKALVEPVPFYKPSDDTVYAWHNVSFGRLQWGLPSFPLPVTDMDTACAAFGCALLQGKVFKALEQLSRSLQALPQTLLQPEGRGHRRVLELLLVLKKHR